MKKRQGAEAMFLVPFLCVDYESKKSVLLKKTCLVGEIAVKWLTQFDAVELEFVGVEGKCVLAM